MKLPDQLIENMRRIAAEAGNFIRQSRIGFDDSSVMSKESRNELVSHVDKGSEALIVGQLQKLLPGSGFIAEENTASNRAEYNWIIDPLDGTTNFVHDIPSYAVSIAIEHHGEILAGVVYEVTHGESYYAEKGKGAFLDEKPLHVSDRRRMADSLIATGFPVSNFTRTDALLGALAEIMRGSRGVRRIGAAAVDLCYLARGRFDGFYEFNLSPWDVAAGALIVKEAGGTVRDFRGGGDWLFGKEIVCTNGHICEEFSNVIARWLA